MADALHIDSEATGFLELDGRIGRMREQERQYCGQSPSFVNGATQVEFPDDAPSDSHHELRGR